MVCLGNICRSPLAQGILEDRLLRASLSAEVDSAGIGGWHAGEAPDPRSCAVARKYGMDISAQRARKLELQDLHTFDRIYAMDRQNLRDILHLCGNEAVKSRISLIMDEVYPGQEMEVPDPYYDNALFEPVFQMLQKASDQIVLNWMK
jgi:protein-tyrosine phosphatase